MIGMNHLQRIRHRIERQYVADLGFSPENNMILSSKSSKLTTYCQIIAELYSSHFKIRQLYLLPLGEGWMRDYENLILKCDEYNQKTSEGTCQFMNYSG
jgi:hypothetical protein